MCFNFCNENYKNLKFEFLLGILILFIDSSFNIQLLPQFFNSSVQSTESFTLCTLLLPYSTEVLPLLKNHIISYRISHLPPIINKITLSATYRLLTCQVTCNNYKDGIITTLYIRSNEPYFWCSLLVIRFILHYPKSSINLFK